MWWFMFPFWFPFYPPNPYFYANPYIPYGSNPYFMYPNPFSPYSPETELQFLKERERMIQEELEWIKKRIKEIEGGGE